jgi:hypothetical protein
MQIDLANLERVVAVLGGIVVALVSARALWNDRHAKGMDDHVFQLMLGLLCLGAIIAILAGVGVLGNFAKA